MQDRSDARGERPTLLIRVGGAVLFAALAGTLSVRAAAAAGTAATANGSDGLAALAPCPHCRLFVGVGGTYQLWGWSDGLIIPLQLEIDDSRWELGAFRLARKEVAVGYGPPDKTAAEPNWGFSAMRRWQILHRSWGRLYFGFGGAYKLETDYVSSSRANFAYVLAARFALGRHGALLEIATRHWSNAWIKQPNRGVNFVTASVSF
jgi:Lipid A 3-O-deacylase (PagL)